MSEETREALRRLHPASKRRVRAALRAIGDDPTGGEPLGEELAGLRKIRLGQLRIVYALEPPTIRVHALGPRETVYVDLIARLPLRERQRRYRAATVARRRAAATERYRRQSP